MNIQQLNQSLPFLFKSGLAVNIIGKHGIGKSSVIAQFAAANGYSYHPFFLGQLNDMGDVLGLPEFNRDKDGKATSVSFVHPDKLPKKPRSILHFDELNRASKDLLQGIFQLALEGEIHDYRLPEDSIVLFSMNPATDDYSVLDFADKAFADRFVHINLDPTHEEFHSYMGKRYGDSNCSRFLQQQTKLLEENDLAPVTLDFVKPSRRSWDRLQKLENTGIPESLFRECGMGIVGTAAMIAYSSWKETQVKIVDGKDILNSYPKVRNSYISYFKNPATGEEIEVPRTDVVNQVCSTTAEEIKQLLDDDKVTEEQVENFYQFLMDSPIENCYATLIGLVKNEKFSTNSELAKLHTKKDLINRCLEAQKAKEAYKTQEESKK